jgi:hypothetical protein
LVQSASTSIEWLSCIQAEHAFTPFPKPSPILGYSLGTRQAEPFTCRKQLAIGTVGQTLLATKDGKHNHVGATKMGTSIVL